MEKGGVVMYTDQIAQWMADARKLSGEGHVADYIPALKEGNPAQLGLCLIGGTDGSVYRVGEWDVPFTLQSVSKVVSFAAVCAECGIEQVLEHVDVEPTGDPYNSILRLETHEPGKPFNPMINAGAITVASLLPGSTVDAKMDVLVSLLEKMIGRRPAVNLDVFQSEWETANRNRALAYYLKDAGHLMGDVEEALEVYLKQCALEVNCEELAHIGLVLAMDGYHPQQQEWILPQRIARLSKALMLTCGMYNASGKFAAFVGVPAKSGVSGAIMAAVPPLGGPKGVVFRNGCGIGLCGPAIDEFGNSVGGVHLLERMAQEWDLSLF